MSLIKKPNELTVNPKIKALVYGASGIGKTTLAISAKNPLLFDCDNGFHRTNDAHWCDAIQVSKEVIDKRIKDAEINGITLSDDEHLYGVDAINHVLDNEDLSNFDAIIIDTFGKLLDYLAEKIIEDNKGNAKIVQRDGSLGIGGFGVLKTKFSDFCRKVNSKGKNLVFVAHDKGKVAKGSDVEKREVLSLGSSYDSVKTELDIVLYVFYQNSTRMITANPTQFNDGKNTIGLPDMEIPIVVNSQGQGLKNDFFDKYIITPYVARMQQIEANRKGYDTVCSELRTKINAIDTPEKANEFAKEYIIQGFIFKHIGASAAYAREIFSAKVNELGYKWNDSIKEYECS